MKKIYLSIFLSLILFLSLINFSIAQEEEVPPWRKLEVEYPEIPGAMRPTTVKVLLPEYIRYIFNFIVIISGLIIFGSLIYGGILWLTSAGDPNRLKSAQDRIFYSFVGGFIVLGSYLILSTINPQVVVLEKSEIEPARGIVLYSEGCSDRYTGSGEKIVLTTDSTDIGFDAKSFKIIAKPRPEEVKIKLYSDSEYKGTEIIEGSSINDCENGCEKFTEVCKNISDYGIDKVRSVKFSWNIPGIYLCNDIMEGGKCQGEERILSISTDSLEEDFDNKVKSIMFRPVDFLTGMMPDTAEEACNSVNGRLVGAENNTLCFRPPWYAAVLHEQPRRDQEKSKCEVFIYPDFNLCEGTNQLTGAPHKLCNTVSSVTVFKLGEKIKEGQDELSKITFKRGGDEEPLTDEGVWLCQEEQKQNCWGPFTYAVVNNVTHIGPEENKMSDNAIESIYNPDDKYLVVLFDGWDFDGVCGVFSKSADTLRGHKVFTCGWPVQHSCVSSFIILPLEEEITLPTSSPEEL